MLFLYVLSSPTLIGVHRLMSCTVPAVQMCMGALQLMFNLILQLRDSHLRDSRLCTQADELYKICSVLGTPTQQTWPEGLKLSAAMNFRFPTFSPTPLSKVCLPDRFVLHGWKGIASTCAACAELL